MVSRRSFLGHSCSLGVAATTLTSSMATLGFARQAAAQQSFSDYKALVCVCLNGGNDSYNMLVPVDSDQHTEYESIRTDLALEQSSLLTLPGASNDGRSYGLHPNMSETFDLYGDSDIAFIANVGTLIDYVDAAAVEAGARVPLGIGSHNDQIAQWQTARPDKRVPEGWGGRLADLMQGVNADNGISMNISLAGTNAFQTGKRTNEYAINRDGDGAIRIWGYEGAWKKTVIDRMFEAEHDHPFRREYRRRLVGAIDTGERFVEAFRNGTPIDTAFSDGRFSAGLRQIARVIAAREHLGASRQTFFINIRGWDHHDEVLDNHVRMLPEISLGLAEFKSALIALGVFDQVSTFTISDFGRTLTTNGKGSDHGWGGHQMVMGGAVRGGQIYGDYPTLSASSPLDVGRGVYVPTTAVDQYFAELALWFGVSQTDLPLVLPNVRRFYSASDTSPPLGFLA